MILVVGTKRSGTSMWMQVLRAAGIPVIGDAFPMQWKNAIGEANPQGFFESLFRDGVHYRTNPHPATGAFLSPSQAAGRAVKVFPTGLVRTDLAYVEKVVATIRPWRDYVASVHRLLSLEDQYNIDVRGAVSPRRGLESKLPYWGVWWLENFQLVRDIATRGHAAVLISYTDATSHPAEVVGHVLEWLDAPDPEAGVAAVLPPREIALPLPEGEAEPAAHYVAVFDDLYDAVCSGGGLSGDLLAAMNDAFVSFCRDFEVPAL